MTFSSQLEAKRFLVAKITSEAEHEGAALSDVEKRMLLFSEQEPESMVGFPDGYVDDIDEEYERRVTTFLKAAYTRDRDNPLERQQYADAMQTLDGSDHYILVMAEAAFPRALLGMDEIPKKISRDAVKNIEINSDKYTVLAILFALALMLLTFASGLYHLTTHNVAFPGTISIWRYVAAIYTVFMSVSIFRDPTLRKTYPHGMAGMACLMIGYVVELIAPWLKLPAEEQNLLWTTLRFVEVVGSALVLGEGVRWFRKNSYFR